MKPKLFFAPIIFLLIALLCLFIFHALSLSTSSAETSPPTLEVGPFSTAKAGGNLPEGWKPLTFEKISTHTQYSLIKDGNTVVVKAVSQQSSSGLTRKITIDPKQYPIVQWRWKINNVLTKGDVTKREGDDYPARIYITFAYNSSKVGFFDKAKFELIKLVYGEYPPIGAINYIWESHAPVGTLAPNPFTDHVQMIVVESGEQKAGRWVMEERNVYEDYTKAFGEEPLKISGIAIMTDTDNTKESAVSYFGDIVFKPSKKH